MKKNSDMFLKILTSAESFISMDLIFIATLILWLPITIGMIIF